MRYITLLMAILFSTITNAEILSGKSLSGVPNFYKTSSCFNEAMIEESLSCPKGQDIKALDNRFQTAGIFLSYLPGNLGAIQSDNDTYLQEMLLTLNKVAYRGIVNILIEPETKESYLAFIRLHAGALKINTLEYSDPVEVNVYKWLQDGLQFAYKNGHPVVIALNSVHEFGRASEIAGNNDELYKSVLKNVHDRFAGQIAKACNLELIYKEETLTKESRDWSSGGNFTPAPGNNWILAGNVYDYDDYPDRQETLYPDVYSMYDGDFPYVTEFFEPAQLAFVDTVGNGENAIDVPTAFFGIGHIDESISFIPVNNPEKDQCDFGVLYADPVSGIKKINENFFEKGSYEEESFIERSEYLEKSVQDFITRLESKVGCKIKSAKAPIPATLSENGESYLTGNQLNGLVIRDGNKTNFITSKVENTELNLDFMKSLHSLDSSVNFYPIDATIYNLGTGGVHCATASIRVCK